MTLKLHIWWITLSYLTRVAIKWGSVITVTLTMGFLIS